MDDRAQLILGSADGEHLSIHPLRRSHPQHTDFWDGNWLRCAMAVRVGGFAGNVEGDLRAEELVEFRDGLRALQQKMPGQVAFRTMEEWLSIRIEGDKLGHIEAFCELRDAAGVGNKLTFRLRFDQTYLEPMLRALEDICTAFPIVGAP